jgi:uncharacterized protein involved in exopolysaccharide biosynthesis
MAEDAARVIDPDGDYRAGVPAREVDLAELAKHVWRARLTIAAAELIAVILAIVFLQIMPTKYTASMQVLPTPDATNPIAGLGGSKMLSGLAGLAGLASLKSDDKFDEFQALVVSQRVAQILIDKDKHVLPVVFEHQWDAQSKTWHPPTDPIGLIARFVKPLFGYPSWHPPDAADLARYLGKHLDINSDLSSSIVTISLEHKDGAFARRLLAELYFAADQAMQQEERQRTIIAIDYLKKELDKESVVDYRSMLLDLLSSQEAQYVTLIGGQAYAAKLVEPPVISASPTSPNAAITLIGFFVVGLIGGIATSLWRDNAEV